MKVINGLQHIHGLSLALGFFDGVHTGHAVVLRNAVKYAKESGVQSGVILFNQHPRELFEGHKIKQLIDFNDKISMLGKIGVDYVFVLDFNEDIAKMTSLEYMEKIILPYFQPSAITTGFNHTFGQGGLGNSKTLKEYADMFNFKYFEIPQITSDNTTISSSSIKNAVQDANFSLAQRLLGYHFYFKSPVIHGRKIGRTINFPTANLIYPEYLVDIETGVYYVYVNTKGNTYRGIMNYGHRPTIDRNDVSLVPEVHLLNYSGNLYGSILKVSFIAKIREEKPFNSLTELKEQLEKDKEFAEAYPFQDNR